MTTPIYSKINYRKNITMYWQQYFPNWAIPKGFHVHHIKPKGTFEDKNAPFMHHPKNLIALHPDDHASIHISRGDIVTSNGNKGSCNPNAKKWKITDPINNEYLISGDLITFAKNNNLSAWTLANIAKTGLPALKGKCIGWFCEYI